MSLFRRIKARMVRKSRDDKLDHFYSLCKTQSKILDVGVSEEKSLANPHLNHFLRTFRYPSEFYSGLGVQNLSGMSEKYPGKRFVQYQGEVFPFADKEFAWVFSNAVVEHVGGYERQVQFINEMLRVSGDVFFTTPNKLFPIESHTNVLFIHWVDSLFFWWLRLRRKPWWNENTLNLLSCRDLTRLLKASKAKSFVIHKNRVFGLTMTFTVICSA